MLSPRTLFFVLPYDQTESHTRKNKRGNVRKGTKKFEDEGFFRQKKREYRSTNTWCGKPMYGRENRDRAFGLVGD